MRTITLLTACAMGLTACALVYPLRVPMRTLPPHGPARHGDCLVVFLPGRWDAPREFHSAGFDAMLTARRPGYDQLAADAHIRYYESGTVLDRLHGDVVGPALRQGYRQVWLVGISLGGLGAAGYAARYPGEVAGLVLLSPFLGEEDVVQEIRRAGGLASWRPEATLAADDYARRLWQWLSGYATRAERPPLYLGYGADDRMAEADATLAAVLPADHVAVVPGGHDWRTWTQVWETLLDRGVPPPCPGRGGAGAAR